MWAAGGIVNENDSNYRYQFAQPTIVQIPPNPSLNQKKKRQAVGKTQLSASAPLPGVPDASDEPYRKVKQTIANIYVAIE
jgi:hypothetical protein